LSDRPASAGPARDAPREGGSPTLVIVSGLSGAGRTTAVKALEDLGYYCVDNLPVVLLERFVDLFGEGADRLAVVIDVRERGFLGEFPEIHARLRERGTPLQLLFLEASDETLVARYGETRRVHPTAARSLLEGIARERSLLDPLAQRADRVIDTTNLSVHELKRLVTRQFSGADRSAPLELKLLSFGFRYGVPEAADLMIDVRFLPNPNFEPGLRARTGLDPEVAAYALEAPSSRAFLERFFAFLDFLLPHYEAEGKAQLTVAIGCTGGQHRSVAVVCALERHLLDRRVEVQVSHRDVEKSRRTET
jgi:UPF0042 nucleotide-binding protein